MARVLLDTTVLIDLLRGSKDAVRRLEELRQHGDTPYVCAVNAEEVARGLRPSEKHAVARLMAGMREAPLGKAEGEQAGSWRRQFAGRGKSLAQSDCLIAAAAAGIGARLATANVKDFPMKSVQVDHWPPKAKA